jgi:hypothetical protein
MTSSSSSSSSSSTAASAVYHPTIEQLRQRAEEGGYGGGRGVMDTREWYELCYFEPLEDFLYEALEAKYYPKMDARNISVCVSVWIYAHSVEERPTYEHVSDRILWSESYDMGAEVVTGRTKPETAMQQTFERGFIFYNKESDRTIVTLRQDIEEFLSKLVDKECAASDAELIRAHGITALDEINEIHTKKQVEFAKDFVKFLFKQNEKGEEVPLTEQEQQDYVESIERRNDDRRHTAGLS